MAGRGFLKNQWAQKLAKNSEQPPESQNLPKPQEFLKPIEPPKSEEETKPPDDVVPTVSAPVMSSGSLFIDQPYALRGRRAMMAHLARSAVSKPVFGEQLTPQFLKMGIQDLSPNATSISKSELSKSISTTLPQPQPVDVDNSREDKPPVICRVSKKSDRDTYCMAQLSSNYIQVILEENKGIYEYRVDYDPPVDAKSARFFLLNEHRTMFPIKTFDGTLLYLPTMLPQNVTILVGKLRDESEVTMTITFKRKNSLRECIHFYNVFLHSIMKILGLIEFGRNCFDKEKRIIIPEFQLEVWPGFITTIDEFESGLFMCCEVSHRVLRVQTVLQIMTEIGIKCQQNGKDSKQEMMSVLCGSTIITHYNNKTYRIDDIDFSMTPLSTFDHHGTNISFMAYYKKNYDIEIKNPNQPMLISKAKRKDINKKIDSENSDICCLVPELCNLTGLTDAMKTDFKLMKALQAHTLVSPEVRQNAIINFVNRINSHEIASKKFKDWGLVLNPVPVKLEGPVYKRENIILGNGIRKQVGINMDWGMDVAKNAMFSSVNLSDWAILYHIKDESTAKSFCKQLSMCGNPLGMRIDRPRPIKVQGTNPEIYISAVNSAVTSFPNLQIVVIIVPNQREDRYNAIKRICCADMGIPSQVIVSKTLSRPERMQSITQKIALQMNCKLGGSCWAIDIPLRNTMLVGIDVYHEKSKQLSSVVGFVASMDKTFTQWYSVAGIQNNTHQEIMTCIQKAFHKVVHQYQMKNGVLPEKIIIYRDGVSDGDLKHVENIELKDLQDSFKSYPGNYRPMVTCIIVQKRINTRVFQYLNEKYSNPSSGTVIDNTVTKRNVFDFYLVSQHVRQGTVNPTHYVVLKNECNMSVENVQRLSYKLCHLYYNWCGTVKVAAPVQYAHKLAYLIGQNVRKMPADSLCDSLFFL